jgi:hypothetical protein
MITYAQIQAIHEAMRECEELGPATYNDRDGYECATFDDVDVRKCFAKIRAGLAGETVDAKALDRVSALALVHKWRAKADLNEKMGGQQQDRCIAELMPEATFHEGALEAYDRCAAELAVAAGMACRKVREKSSGVLGEDYLAVAFRAEEEAIDERFMLAGETTTVSDEIAERDAKLSAVLSVVSEMEADRDEYEIVSDPCGADLRSFAEKVRDALSADPFERTTPMVRPEDVAPPVAERTDEDSQGWRKVDDHQDDINERMFRQG